MSPRERNRNVPLSWWPRRRLPIGKDRDECEGTDTGRGTGAGEGGRVECEIGGGVAARRLPPGEAIDATVSGGRGQGTEAPERGTPVESCAAHGRTGAGVGVGAGEVQRAGGRAVWTDASRRASGERRRRHRSSRHAAAVDVDGGAVESCPQTRASSAATGAQGAFRRARAAGWQFPLVVRDARAARLLDEPRRR